MNQLEREIEIAYKVFYHKSFIKTELYVALISCNYSSDVVLDLTMQIAKSMGFINWRDLHQRATPEQYQQLFDTLRKYAKNAAFM